MVASAFECVSRAAGCDGATGLSHSKAVCPEARRSELGTQAGLCYFDSASLLLRRQAMLFEPGSGVTLNTDGCFSPGWAHRPSHALTRHYL
jgi:hypothetical protein